MTPEELKARQEAEQKAKKNLTPRKSVKDIQATQAEVSAKLQEDMKAEIAAILKDEVEKVREGITAVLQDKGFVWDDGMLLKIWEASQTIKTDGKEDDVKRVLMFDYGEVEIAKATSVAKDSGTKIQVNIPKDVQDAWKMASQYESVQALYKFFTGDSDPSVKAHEVRGNFKAVLGGDETSPVNSMTMKAMRVKVLAHNYPNIKEI